MRLPQLLLALPVAAAVLVQASDTAACGACIGPSETTVVTGHRMVLSVSPQGTTLWDQFSYAGEPSSFAWVLPTKGIVEVGLSSDAVFQTLEGLTQVTVQSPPLNCPPPPNCGFQADGNAGGTSGAGGGGPPVEVLAQETVGPFETVQLASDDPNALYDWLQSHGYLVPADFAPVIDAYVAEGFNFLALKLVPGQGVDAMRPVRVSTPGADATLPLRMVAGGTGAITPITLWVLGEGRYAPTNFPTFQIDQDDLVWDWDQQRSNYTELRQIGFQATNGFAWLEEAGEQLSSYSLEYPLMDLVSYDPLSSGYGDPGTGEGATEELVADLEKLYGGIPEGSLWVTRISAELSRAALIDDLDLGASPDQSYVNRFLQAEQSTGTEPECPSFPPCDDWSGEGPDNGIDAPGGEDVWGSGTCAISTGGGGSMALGGLALAAALALSRRRRGRSGR